MDTRGDRDNKDDEDRGKGASLLKKKGWHTGKIKIADMCKVWRSDATGILCAIYIYISVV